jgi:hypothetical protein
VNRIIIPLPLMTLNQYIKVERGNMFGGAKVKKQATEDESGREISMGKTPKFRLVLV